MLPDFPAEKEQVADALLKFFEKRMQGYMVPFDEVRRYVHHEGNTHEIIRADGDSTKSTYDEISSSFTLKIDRQQRMTPEEVLRELDRSAREMAEETKKSAFRTISEAVEKVGNVISQQGQPFTSDTLLKTLEKMAIDFEDGEPMMPTMVVGPELGEKLRSLLPQWESDPAFQRRFSEIIERKRLEWRDHEARRRLVD